MISKFETLSKTLQNNIKTLLSDQANGNLDTFYSHVLHWYQPEITKKVYSKYKHGPGIFTMEAFEAMNFATQKCCTTNAITKVMSMFRP